MNDIINVLGIKMDCLSAKEAMIRAIQFMENDSVDTIEILSMRMLMDIQNENNGSELAEGLTLLLPGVSEILEAASVTDRRQIKETDNRTFLKMFMKYLQRNRKRVFLLAETEEELRFQKECINRYNKGIKMTGYAVVRAEDDRDEEIVNEINGTETDCIISVLSSPFQEQFIKRNKPLLNVKVWFGCGSMLDKTYNEQKPLKKLRRFFLTKRFWSKVEKEQKESDS